MKSDGFSMEALDWSCFLEADVAFARMIWVFISLLKAITDRIGGDKIWTSDNALFSVWIGINDLGNSYYESGDRDACVACMGLDDCHH